MRPFTDDGFKRAIPDETGIKAEWAAEAFAGAAEHVRQSVARVKASLFIRGFAVDVAR